MRTVSPTLPHSGQAAHGARHNFHVADLAGGRLTDVQIGIYALWRALEALQTSIRLEEGSSCGTLRVPIGDR